MDMQNQEPCFTSSENRVFVNLHNAAQEKAAAKLKIANNPKTANSIIVNTAISKDGTNVHMEKVIPTNSIVSKLFGKKDRKYELGIILQPDEYERLENEALTASKDVLKDVVEKNKDSINALKDKATEGIKEYFNWFAGVKDIGEPVQFIPVYKGADLKLKGYTIVQMDDDDMKEYFEKLPEDEKPRIGFKVGYTIVYDKPDEKKSAKAASQS